MEDIKSLIESFKAYRDLLTPVSENLKEFADTYENLKGDLERLNTAFGGDVSGNLDKIYKNLSSQAARATDLSTQIDKFIKNSESYSQEVDKLGRTLGKLEVTLSAMNRLEAEAETQIGKLESTLEEKRKNYNLKDLERTIDNYNNGVQKMSEFINEDIAGALTDNYEKLGAIKQDCANVAENVKTASGDIGTLVSTFAETNALLRKVTEGESVNEAYIYDILDKWAADRGVKRKK